MVEINRVRESLFISDPSPDNDNSGKKGGEDDGKGGHTIVPLEKLPPEVRVKIERDPGEIDVWPKAGD